MVVISIRLCTNSWKVPVSYIPESCIAVILTRKILQKPRLPSKINIRRYGHVANHMAAILHGFICKFMQIMYIRILKSYYRYHNCIPWPNKHGYRHQNLLSTGIMYRDMVINRFDVGHFEYVIHMHVYANQVYM